MTYEIIKKDKSAILLHFPDTEEGRKREEDFFAAYRAGRTKEFEIAPKRFISRFSIQEIIPVQEERTLPSNRRLESVQDKEEEVEVPGGWQKPSVREGMKAIWEKWKTRGQFRGFGSYEQWEHQTYCVNDGIKREGCTFCAKEEKREEQEVETPF